MSTVENEQTKDGEEQANSTEAGTAQDEAANPAEEEAAAGAVEADENGAPPADEVEEEEVDPLVKAQAEANENYDRYLRAKAELDNYRKRTTRLRADSRDDALRDVLVGIAPILDNLRRALEQQSEDSEALKQGVGMIVGQFQDVLKNYGLEEIVAVGEPFDPNLHEAMLEIEHDEYDAGIIVQEMEKGYRLRDKVLRPSRVVVSKGGTQEAE